ncbi:MAG: glycosyltransferase [Cyclobacteriaceae bacterium]|nr:glycosyltransferase [Cyclobacteriaceae bacterium]
MENQHENDIVYFTLSRIDSVYSSPALSLAKELSKTNRVFYINHPYSIKDFLLEIFRSKRLKRLALNLLFSKTTFEKGERDSNFVSVVPPLTLPINWLGKGALYNFLWRLNNKRMLGVVERTIKKFGIQSFIFVNSYDPYLLGWIPERMNPKLNIYQSIDDISQDPYTQKHGVQLEIEAVKHADIVIVTGSKLKEKLKAYNSEIHVLNNAVDFSIFGDIDYDKIERPSDLKAIKGPIIGFTGNLDRLRVDYPLIKSIALSNPQRSVVMVGPINNSEIYDLGIDKLENVYLLGHKDISQLPQYLKFMDVTIIPFLCNELTSSIYPLKINEYLAAGKPVVSTNFSKDINDFGEVITLAGSHQQFIEGIDKALEDKSIERVKLRKRVAFSNTWSARKQQFWNIIDNVNKAQ